MVGYIVIITIFILRVFVGSVKADTYDPSYTSSPSAKTSSPPTANIGPNCNLDITYGNNSLAPRNVSFEVKNHSSNQIKYDFGDGTVEVGGNLVNHHYSQAGTYSVTATVLTINNSSASCNTTVSLKSPPITPHVSACTNLTLTSGTSLIASKSASITVKGFDNKAEISNYKLYFGDQIFEQAKPDFVINIATPGSYLVKAYIKDSTDKYVGGEGKCDTSMLVKSAIMTTQPATGPSTWYLPTIIGLLVISLWPSSIALSKKS